MKPIEFVCGQNWVDQAENNRRDCHPTLESNANEHGWDMLYWMLSWSNAREGARVWLRRWAEMKNAGTYEHKIMLR